MPASLLQVSTYVGGIVIGAFTDAGELAGFVFGLTGVEDGHTIHWSHLLGVRASTRNSGIGRMLKDAQRAELARRNVGTMSWTFDPLVAKNAHFNLNRLGARVVEYVPDMYGTTTSPLHYGLATDRLIVTCDTNGELANARDVDVDGPILGLDLSERDALSHGSLPATLRIEIPADIKEVIDQSPEAAAAWREAVRSHFQWALAHGYEVIGATRDPLTARCTYSLSLRAA